MGTMEMSWFTMHRACVAMSTGSRGSAEHAHTDNHSPSGSLSDHSDGGDGDDAEQNANSPHGGTTAAARRALRDRTDAWWSVGEFLEGKGVALTHQSAKFTLTGNRVFNNNQKEEVWDLTDSLAELYETIARTEGNTLQQMKRARNVDNKNRQVDIKDWLSKEPSHGFLRVYAPDMTNFANSRLVPCTLSTTVQQVAHSLGLSMNSLHIQLNGDVIRRMDAYEHPLVIQNEYLAGLGYDDIIRIQEEGPLEELGYLIRFYAGKPMVDSTFSRNQLQAFLEIRKGGVLQNWVRKLCTLSGTRLLIFKDKYKRSQPAIVQLAKGAVEEVKLKGHDFVLRLTTTLGGGERIFFLSFATESEYTRWYKKCKKATDKLPTAADLSNCHLEFLPENIFINDQLAMLNLRHNVLRERPIEEDIFIIGWLDDLHRFASLRSLNLADNHLLTFPVAICHIRTLVELNIASNKLEEIPPDIAELTNLQALHIHNNHLTSLPDEMMRLRKLFILVLAFNRFIVLPPVVAQMTNIRISEVENIIMAGNRIERIPSETLMEMKYVKKVDLRMNKLRLTTSETMKFSVLEHLTHLDIQDNDVLDLDIRALRTLEYLNCERNRMTALRLNGQSLKNLFAGHNCLDLLQINPKPEWLLHLDVSYNDLQQLPEWLSDCIFLQRLNASHNQLFDLPARLFVEARKLKSLRVNHNRLLELPCELGAIHLEEIHVQHNLLSRLPYDFLALASKLRVFNATKNRLTSLPKVNANEDLNKVQELYLAGNCLGDSIMETVSGYPRLKILHLAHNEIYNLYDRDVKKLEMLQELNISGNELRQLPKSVGELSKLVVLRAHSNMLQSLPDLKNAKSLRVLDVGHNHLLNVSVTSLMASQLNLLDMSLNTQLKVDPREFKSVKNRKSVCLVDLTGQNRDLPGLVRRTAIYQGEEELDPNTPWKVGFSETSGMRNKLCIGTLKMPKFGSEDEAIFGMFDGGHNNEVPKKLLECVPDILKDEMVHHKTDAKYLKYTILSAHRALRATGQKLGASAMLIHLKRMTADKMNQYIMQLGNVGDVEAVLCRHGEPLVLTRKFLTTEDQLECERLQRSDGIITEDSKVNGVTRNTRLIGCAFLSPHIIPDPFTCELPLRNDDEFIIVANRGLWKFVSYIEAVEEIYEIGNPIVAAKHLQDLAQGYGSKENISILVIRLNTEKGPSLARLRPGQREMSIDDIEAAARHDAQQAKKLVEREAKVQRERQKIEKEERDRRQLERERRIREKKEKTQLAEKQKSNGASSNRVEDTKLNGRTAELTGGPSKTVVTIVYEEEEAQARPDAMVPPPVAFSNPQISEDAETNPPDAVRGSTTTLTNGGSDTTLHDNNDGEEASSDTGTSMDTVREVVIHARPVDVTPTTHLIPTVVVVERRPPVRQPERVTAPPPPAPPPPAPAAAPASVLKAAAPANLKPLPNRRFVKQNTAQEWESILQQRLMVDVKDKELKQLSRSVSGESMLDDGSGSLTAVEIDLDKEEDAVMVTPRKPAESAMSASKGSLRLRSMNITAPWMEQPQQAANPAYALNPGISTKDMMDMTASDNKTSGVGGVGKPKRRPRVMDRIALFENLKAADPSPPVSPPASPTRAFPAARTRAPSPTPPRSSEPTPQLPARSQTPVPGRGRPSSPLPPPSNRSRPTSRSSPPSTTTTTIGRPRSPSPALLIIEKEPSTRDPARNTRSPISPKTNSPGQSSVPKTATSSSSGAGGASAERTVIIDASKTRKLKLDIKGSHAPASAPSVPSAPGGATTSVQAPPRRLPKPPSPAVDTFSEKRSSYTPSPTDSGAMNESSILRSSGRRLPSVPRQTQSVASRVLEMDESGGKKLPHGSVENDLYAHIKKLKKDPAPLPPPAAFAAASPPPSKIAMPQGGATARPRSRQMTPQEDILEVSRL